MNPPDLTALLQRYWGFGEFRKGQEPVIRAILEGRDVAVIMPTGGGKSLCYQLPAVAMQKPCIVVSPLIALMQDQAAHLASRGIPAGFLNSLQDAQTARRVQNEAAAGRLKLLYLAPERLLRDDTLDWLRRIDIGLFAIDEAHCISEWGHEFRPEYRRLRLLRELFPHTPIAAFTASATRAVRHDIVAQLRLRQPACLVTSFHRPNLRYMVKQCQAKEHERLLKLAIQAYPGSNVIVYAPTIKQVEETTALFANKGAAVVGYHGQMPAAQRQKNQDLWMSGKKRILIGTLAFGMGINKADVRAVIHLALPKSLEQYYQEAGRAGRDGQTADCVLLWQKRDAALLAHFIKAIADPAERQRAWQRYHVMRRFAEEDSCRHLQICRHFGETPRWTACSACDVCGEQAGWMTAATVRTRSKRAPARKRKSV